MNPTLITFLIVCPTVGLAGFVDAIGGGGGLISLPVYMLAGLPTHQAIATNKLSSTCGTALATWKFIREKLVDFRLAIPAVIAAIAGSSIGAHISLMLNDKVIKSILLVALPIAAFFVLNKKLFHDSGERDIPITRRTLIISILAAFIIGIYDGIYGPGTGTFLIIALTVFAKMGLATSNAQTKVINLTTNVTSLAIFLINGKVLLSLGIAAAICNMVGNYIGANLSLSKGSTISRPIIIIVLILLAIKVIGGF